MRRFLVLAVLTLAIGSVPKTVMAGGAPNREMHELRRQQKKQRKMFAGSQRAMKDVMKRHPQSPEQHRRFQHDMKMQRQLFRGGQKAEVRSLKQGRKSVKRKGKDR